VKPDDSTGCVVSGVVLGVTDVLASLVVVSPVVVSGATSLSTLRAPSVNRRVSGACSCPQIAP